MSLATGTGQVRLDEVYLSGVTASGPTVVGGLALLADEASLTVLGPEPTSIRRMPWSRATTIACRQPAQLPDGRDAVALEIAIDGVALRFFLPTASLGPEGAGALEAHLIALARVPARPAEMLAPPTAIGGQVAPGGPPGVVAPVGAGQRVGNPTVGGSGPPATGYGAASGGAVAGSPRSGGHYVQVGKHRRGRSRIVAGILVVVIIAGGAGAYVWKKHNSSNVATSSKDSVAASAVNITPGELPGWKGVPGTIAGAIGAVGFSNVVGNGSPAGPTVALAAANNFDKCTKLSATAVDPELALLGFSNGLAGVPNVTAESSSLLYQDPSAVGTAVESSSIVLGSVAQQSADFSVFDQPFFATCFRTYLDAVVPALVGSSVTGSAFKSSWVASSKVTAAVPGVQVLGFGILLSQSGKGHATQYLDLDVISGGRMIAATETISPHPFPPALSSKLISGVETSVAGES